MEYSNVLKEEKLFKIPCPPKKNWMKLVLECKVILKNLSLNYLARTVFNIYAKMWKRELIMKSD